MGAVHKEKDIELWQKWKATKAMTDLEPLMKQMAGPINTQVTRWATVAPRFLLENEAKKLALQAFETFDPNRGVALATHVINWLQKLSRLAYERQSTMSIPEHKRIQYNQLMRAKTQLEDTLGAPATLAQLADHMAVTPEKVKSLLTEVEKREYLESEEHPSSGDDQNESRQIDLAFHDLTPLQQKIFKWKTGYEAMPVKDNHSIMKELNLTQGQLSYELTKIKTILLQAQGRK
jgi:DNA-directed RNA polymerase specialized sigma subunit